MKTLTVNRNSWHYRLAKLGNVRPYELNICNYIRCFLGGVGYITFCAALVFIACFLVGDFLAWVAAMLVNLIYFDPGVAALIATSIFGAAFLFLLCFLISHFGVKAFESADSSFIGAAYDSFKNKYCFKVKVQDDVTD
jgi:hypothetical protein